MVALGITAVIVLSYQAAEVIFKLIGLVLKGYHTLATDDHMGRPCTTFTQLVCSFLYTVEMLVVNNRSKRRKTSSRCGKLSIDRGTFAKGQRIRMSLSPFTPRCLSS